MHHRYRTLPRSLPTFVRWCVNLFAYFLSASQLLPLLKIIPPGCIVSILSFQPCPLSSRTEHQHQLVSYSFYLPTIHIAPRHHLYLSHVHSEMDLGCYDGPMRGLPRPCVCLARFIMCVITPVAVTTRSFRRVYSSKRHNSYVVRMKCHYFLVLETAAKARLAISSPAFPYVCCNSVSRLAWAFSLFFARVMRWWRDIVEIKASWARCAGAE